MIEMHLHNLNWSPILLVLPQAFVQILEKEKRPLLTNDSELDGLVSTIFVKGAVVAVVRLRTIRVLVGRQRHPMDIS